MSSPPSRHAQPGFTLMVATATAAAAAPSLLAYNPSPSPTLLNQALALALWGLFVVVCGHRLSARGAGPVLWALAALGAAVVWSWGPGGLPASLALSSLGVLAAAAWMLVAGASAGGPDQAGAALARSGSPQQDTRAFEAFCWAWLIAGLANVVVAMVQVFAPGVPDGEWIAVSSIEGRAVGNLRQPNHLSSLLLWAGVAVVALLELRRLALWAAGLALAALVLAVVLTASRTGLLSVVLLAMWGLADWRLARTTRALLGAAPVMYGVAWWCMAQWAALAKHSFGGAQRLAETDISGSRFGIWANTLELIRLHPWAGVGWGEFNFAWTLTPFPGRPTAFFDHTHNLPLQLAVELGLPLACFVMALLLWALWQGLRRAWQAQGDDSTARRAAMVMVLMIGLHSLLEYPLWYTYFLLPTAWAWGLALRDGSDAKSLSAGQTRSPSVQRRGRGQWLRSGALVGGGMLMALGAVALVVDYTRVVAIYTATPGAPPLEQRIRDGQRSVFFAHHADYAAVTIDSKAAQLPSAFDRVTHYLLDTRLMTAWARSLAAGGEADAARHLAGRLREFRKADAAELFESCPAAALPASAAASAGDRFACELPTQPQRWQSYLPP